MAPVNRFGRFDQIAVAFPDELAKLFVLLIGIAGFLMAGFESEPYLVSALCVACAYSILTTITSARSISKQSPSNKVLLCLAFTDVLMAGVVTSATGAAAAVAYIGIWGNSHTGWIKICPMFDKFCRHIGSSILVSLAACIILFLLIMLSTYSLFRRSH